MTKLIELILSLFRGGCHGGGCGQGDYPEKCDCGRAKERPLSAIDTCDCTPEKRSHCYYCAGYGKRRAVAVANQQQEEE